MKVVFLYMGSENLGVEYLSAILKQHGHKTKLIFDPALFNDKYWFDIPLLYNLFKRSDQEIIDEVISNNPDLICFSSFTDNYQWACRLAEKIKKKANIPIVFGGIHTTSVPERVIKNEFVDFVVVGEGEYPLLDLANKKELKNIPNLIYKSGSEIIQNPLGNLIENLDELPFPDKELFREHIPFNHYMISSSRGCPFQCSYCYSNYIGRLYRGKGKFLRRRSADNVINELILAKDRFKVKKVSFEDDVFTMDKKWLQEFIQKYNQKINLPFRCITHTLFMDEEVAALLKNSPCYKVEMGIQCMDEEIRRKYLKRYEKNEQIFKAMDICKKYKLPVYLDHMFGFPGQSEEVLKMEAKFYNYYRPKRITCYWLQFFPKTEIIEMMNIPKNEIESIETGLEKMYIVGGSVKDKKKIQLIKPYSALFRIIQLLPRPVVSLMLKINAHKVLRFMPDLLLMPLDLLVAIKAKDFKVFNYANYYLVHIKKRLFNYNNPH